MFREPERGEGENHLIYAVFDGVEVVKWLG